MKEERCSNCFYDHKDSQCQEYICYCAESEMFGMYTEYNGSCEYWEDRNG